jgi:mRNA-degrading endonuclease toxin of MazEF toxin-antitoxin module
MVMLKGEIWRADLPRARGSEPAKNRKAFIRECVRTLPKPFAAHIDQSLKTVFDIQN